MAALLGREVVDKDYQKVRIRIAFHPMEQKFEVSNPAIAKDTLWIPDIAVLFDAHTSLFALVNAYCERNPNTSKDEIFRLSRNSRESRTSFEGQSNISNGLARRESDF
jgi:hypothetical protein